MRKPSPVSQRLVHYHNNSGPDDLAETCEARAGGGGGGGGGAVIDLYKGG